MAEGRRATHRRGRRKKTLGHCVVACGRRPNSTTHNTTFHMAWLYEHSAAWRRLVHYTRQSRLHTAGFALTALAGSIAAGAVAMSASSRDAPGGELDAALRARAAASVDGRVLAQANKARLAVLLEETRQALEDKKSGKSGGKDAETRYAAALKGESLGTHSRGTTAGVRAGEEGKRWKGGGG